MPCEVCGKPSGKYPLCKECFEKRETGEIIKCEKCHRWHHVNVTCSGEIISAEDTNYLYAPKHSLLTKSEFAYYKCIKSVLPSEYFLHVQANLASFITKTDCSRYQNELYRNVDFLITDLNYKPLAVIEINDQTHLSKERYGRDEKVAKICEEAGIPIIKLWTSYGINPEYIEKRINKTLKSLPVKRIHHFEIKYNQYEESIEEKNDLRRKHKKGLFSNDNILIAIIVLVGILFAFFFSLFS
ncbi:MAG: DUF2726 domain-containing protein [Oscillospiraceae bacterium]|nr:DUF2726 domain-containing protein [Oscillospiraceae bacterium]MBQ8594579.1 DUF2726 domain-containing protein [Oscillospiraceae bacterium]